MTGQGAVLHKGETQTRPNVVNVPFMAEARTTRLSPPPGEKKSQFDATVRVKLKKSSLQHLLRLSTGFSPADAPYNTSVSLEPLHKKELVKLHSPVARCQTRFLRSPRQPIYLSTSPTLTKFVVTRGPTEEYQVRKCCLHGRSRPAHKVATEVNGDPKFTNPTGRYFWRVSSCRTGPTPLIPTVKCSFLSLIDRPKRQ